MLLPPSPSYGTMRWTDDVLWEVGCPLLYPLFKPNNHPKCPSSLAFFLAYRFPRMNCGRTVSQVPLFGTLDLFVLLPCVFRISYLNLSAHTSALYSMMDSAVRICKNHLQWPLTLDMIPQNDALHLHHCPLLFLHVPRSWAFCQLSLGCT